MRYWILQYEPFYPLGGLKDLVGMCNKSKEVESFIIRNLKDYNWKIDENLNEDLKISHLSIEVIDTAKKEAYKLYQAYPKLKFKKVDVKDSFKEFGETGP